ncbi:arsenate reductase family protein [Lacticigenium naphthae]|uniref:arsenate reductase family protein n=1 Tax=Lacticigenium naphthae TaxID=515351 RepID=UPI000424E780|nr:arsenate reductase family protein [Lacticigenium naphthae]
MITFYCHPTCTTCKKAKQWLEQENQAYTFVSLKETAPTKEELLTYFDKTDKPVKAFFNTSGQAYRKLNLKEKLPTMSKEEAAEWLSSDGMLIKRPLAVEEDKITIGFKETEYEKNWKK